MANVILPTGYETQVLTDLGVTASVLTTTAIQSKATLAEAYIKKQVTTYATIVSAAGDGLVLLQGAAIAKICALLCPGMPQRVKLSQSDETGYSFRLGEVDWVKKQMEFDAIVADLCYLALGEPTTAYTPLGVVTNDALEI